MTTLSSVEAEFSVLDPQIVPGSQPQPPDPMKGQRLRSSEGQPHTADLLVTDEDSRLRSGDLFKTVIWRRAFRVAGLTYRPRADGMHALRHFYASVLMSEGVSIKELAAYLDHADPGFTLRTYMHLVPSSFQRARAPSTASSRPSQTA